MKSGKDEEKSSGPLFPRLHVNDTEKGGPRAPPRNKMALYEQLSIPSQRFNSGSASTMPLPPSNTSSLVSSSSASFTQGGGHERYVFSQYYVPPRTPVNFSEELNSRASDGLNFKTVTPDFEQKSTNNANCRASKAMGHPSSTVECSSFRTRFFPNSKNSYQKKLGDEDDFMVPTFAQHVIGSCTTKDQPNGEREIPSPLAAMNNTSRVVSGTCSSSSQLHNAQDKHLKRPNTTDLRSRQHVRDQGDTSKGCVEKTTSHPSTGEKIVESIKHVYASDSRHQSSLVDDLGRLKGVNAQLHQERRATFFPGNNNRSERVSDDLMVYVDDVNVSRVRNDQCSTASLGNGERSPNKFCEDKTHWVQQVEDVDRNDDVSETSILDSVSSLDISPDDVVGVIGQKHFWKARKAIANQQRVFSVQVFELHRLIKVQRLFAGSPHLLVEDNPYLGKPSIIESPAKRLPSKYVLKSLPEVIKQKDDSSKANRSTECTAENVIEKSPLHSISDGIDRRNFNQHPTYAPYSENPLSGPPAANNQPGWCFHPPPGNQWLVPIMSPSEGLVYKPYSGPCPPAAGYMAPFYGGCGPLSVPPMAGDYLNPAYRFPASHQQPMGHHSTTTVTPNYFPPYGMPVMNSVISPSAVDQVSPVTEQLSTGEFNANMHSRNSSNMSKTRRSEAISRRFSKFQTSKESEVQGSTASSPIERAQGVGAVNISEPMGALPLFPTAPAVQDLEGAPQISNCDRQHTRVIKVVPHNPRSANESAARIFRSIQEERQQFDSV